MKKIIELNLFWDWYDFGLVLKVYRTKQCR